jgi:hypothetical protein
VGRIVIETDPETGMDHVELTLDNGQTLIFHGQGSSELKHVRPEPEMVDVGTAGHHEYIPGLREPDHWHFSIEIDKIPGVIINEPEAQPNGGGTDLEK